MAIHTILRTRQVYPPDLFVKRRRYDAPVFQSRHPALNEYISGAVKAVGEELLMVSGRGAAGGFAPTCVSNVV